jgi:cell division septation protein DedD
MFKFFATIVVLVVAGAALWWTGWLTKFVPFIPLPSQIMKSQPSVDTTAQTTPSDQQPTAVNDLPTATNDASDQALARDAAAIDVQMGALVTDSANAQNSLNDKPVTQEY